MMTLTTVIQVTADGQLELPPEIRSKLHPGDEFVLWQEEDIIILKKVQKPLLSELIQHQETVNLEGSLSFFEIADRLSKLNEIDPISEEEIQEEIQAYKQEKRNLA